MASKSDVGCQRTDNEDQYSYWEPAGDEDFRIKGRFAIVADGMSAIVVEQDVQLARRVSSRFYCFQEGRVSLSGISADVSDEAITQAYFGAVA